MTTKIGIGFIGVGGIAHWGHLKQLCTLPQADLVGYFDTDTKRSEDTAKQYGGYVFPSIDALLSEKRIKAVYICVPPFAHGEPEEKAIAAGKALLIEKPLATTLDVAERIGKKLAAKKLVNAVGYNWRYEAITTELKKRLKSSEIIGASGWWVGERPGVWWWRRKAKCGGQHVEQATHIFDIANYVIGSQPVSVYAVGRKLKHYPEPDHDMEDISTVTVTYKNGVMINVWSSDVMDGRAARVNVEFFAVNRKYELGRDLLRCYEKNYTEITNSNNPYRDENGIFLKAVATGNPSQIRATYATSLIAHRVTLAADRSMKSGKVEKV